MVYVKKKERETSENMIKRFTRRMQQSGVLMRMRKRRFREEVKSKTERRSEALYKARMHKEVERLKKLGRYDQESLRELRKKIKQDQL